MQRATAAKNPERVIKTAPARPVGGAGFKTDGFRPGRWSFTMNH
ncbi:MAG TPA: hypothetical protein VNM37_24055 [Candidatus Dormibacteraeota bacterium]|nr:hypothetical protein [Candidatus Dormibacteraeota bacterium]